MRSLIRQPFDDLLACLEPIVTVRRPVLVVVPLFVAMIVSWIIYVPIHELFHAYACMWTGGEVTQLEIAPRYGGAIYARYFDFVVSGGEYAGRLSGFETHGSDWIYLATDFGPYLLTVFIGVPLIKIAGRGRRPILFALGIIMGLAPFYSLPGDYFEMGSIVTTRAAAVFASESGEQPPDDILTDGPLANVNEINPPFLPGLRSDDVFSLLATLVSEPSKLGLTSPGLLAIGVLMILISMAVSLLFALATYWLGHQVSRVIVPSLPKSSA